LPHVPGHAPAAYRWARSHDFGNAAIAGAATEIASQFVFACTARLEPREMRLAPLPNTPQLRDLATVIAPPDERL